MKRLKKITSTVVLTVLCFLLTPVPATIAAWNEGDNLTEEVGNATEFGYSIDIDGDYMVVGALLDDDAAINGGAVYVYKNIAGTWTQQQKITNSSVGGNGQFGSDVAISGDNIVVGARQAGFSAKGMAFFYNKYSGETWGNPGGLPGNTDPASSFTGPSNNDELGRSVAIDGTTAVVGQYGWSGSVFGGARVYTTSDGGDTWIEQDTLEWPGAGTRLGEDCTVSGDIVVLGAGGDKSIRVYTRSGATWSYETNSPGVIGDGMNNVSIDGTTLIAGVPLDDTEASDAGKVLVYTTSDGGANWSLDQTLTNPDVSPLNSNFGDEVDLVGTKFIVGAPVLDSNKGAGFVYEYSGGTWGLDEKIAYTSASDGDYYGHSLAIDGSDVALGSYFASSLDGAVQTFDDVISGAVPEFHEYVLMLTVVIALGFMIKIVPKMGDGMRAA